MVRRGSSVRVRHWALVVCRDFSSRRGRGRGPEVPNGYVLGDAEAPSQRLKLDGGRGQFAGSRLLSSEMSDRRDGAFLRPEEAAALAGLSKRAIYRAIERGELRAARPCSRLRIPQAAFDDWVERSGVRAGERVVA